MKNFDKYEMQFEWKRHSQEEKYQCKMKALFWKSINDFIKNRMWNRRFDAILVRKFGDNGSSCKYEEFNKRMVFATADRITKSRAFTQYVGEENPLIFLSMLSQWR